MNTEKLTNHWNYRVSLLLSCNHSRDKESEDVHAYSKSKEKHVKHPRKLNSFINTWKEY